MAYVLILITLTSKVQGYFRNSPLEARFCV
jgi:hypothetical protein